MQTRIVGPVARTLRAAGFLAVLSALIWPVQAGAIALAIDGWVGSGAGGLSVPAAAATVLIGGAIRAWLDFRAGGLAFDAADRTIARERDVLLRREARARSGDGSAAIAALIVQKLPMLHPWITRYYVAMVRVSVVPLVLLIVVFSISWIVGLVLLAAGPLIPIFMALIGIAAEKASRRQLAEIGTMNGMLMERLSALLDIRLLGASDRVTRDFERRADALRNQTMAVLRIAFLSSTVLELAAAIGVAMVAVFVGFTLLGEITYGTWGVPLTLGQGIFLLLLAPDYFNPLRDLAAAWHDRAAGLSVVAELEEADRADRIAFVGNGVPGQPLDGPIRVRVSGATVDLSGRVLALPDFDVSAGEAVALRGPSGAGKSTTLAAILGLVPLSAGQIDVCGRRLDADTADDWRSRLSVVPQKPHFADRSLRDYLTPRPDADVSIADALTLAQACPIVDRLPDGLETRLSESGGGVSGGEARRLMIARAVRMDGDLLLADEPTADLDPQTAAMVIDALKGLKAAGKTMLIATHDPALIAAMDRVVTVSPQNMDGETGA
ncbi:ATP-binding cassette domain-containing protein [Rhodospirillaceae bacterium KN72]|uniref:ATP-binding cassette domain-containing protein n=2 Tax=Pacificispira spongiicola TaxID=2729598 RepID=A0A7Y0E3Q5_9PROT|nr:ATP-binding cassette domain-containing protein [Pacificispira spongiicola]